MDKNKQYKVALVLYTQGIDFDDRIRKEILSIKHLYSNVTFKIFAIEPDNREEQGVSSYGVPYRIPYLRSRDKYPSGTHSLEKGLDFYMSIRKELKMFDAVWCADIETFLFIILVRKPLLWDLHELPEFLMGSKLKRCFFRLLERKVKIMIHANDSRLKYLQKLKMVCQLNKQYVLRNFPQFNEIDNEYDDQYSKFVKWRGDSKCIYLQGLDGSKRADLESISAVLHFDEFKAVVVGKITPERKSLMVKQFGEDIVERRLFFTGQIKQLKTPQYIKECYLSLVFYKNISPNNLYCEPNRLFQCVINGVPVIVGNNPPLRDFVDTFKVGICADTDGGDVDKILIAIKQAVQNYDKLKNQAMKIPNELLWSSQDGIIEEIVEKFL